MTKLKKVLDDNHSKVEWIKVSRPKRGNYRINGSDGSLDLTVTRDEFIKLILNR